jgi:hypothetical protein
MKSEPSRCHAVSAFRKCLAAAALVAAMGAANAGDLESPAPAREAPASPVVELDGSAAADTPGHWRAVVSPYTIHFNPSDEHKYVWGVGVEYQRPDRWLFGAVYFSNSFGQPSGYVYVGQRWYDLVPDLPKLFFQWSAGLLYGYKGEYEDKVPFNQDGFSPGALIAVGWQFTPQVSASALLLGNAGLMLQLSYDFR